MFYLDPPARLKEKAYTTVPEALSKTQPKGPCFDRSGRLFVVDIPYGRIFRIDKDKTWTVVAEYDGWPNGLKCTPQGRILVAGHRLGLVEVMPDTGEVTVLVIGYRGERFRGLNDLALGTDGWVYFTDQGQSGLQEVSGCVYRWHQTLARIERVLSDIPSPNGLVLANDASKLFVAVTRSNTIWRAPFVPDGGVSKVGVFLNLSGGGGPDGLAMDLEGGLVVAQPGLGVLRFDDSGVLTNFIQLPADNIYGGNAIFWLRYAGK
ncbi:hypothetical protein Sste5346_000954 [Sporothrix stenoceras]|uniref:SMP-30/Gluconolactonase/LRE-like region domain-containing protein n=1 Tax=Sporothrix stenoceras TaxID=5173 RepID=A0ABR3ZS95_9PEZI